MEELSQFLEMLTRFMNITNRKFLYSLCVQASLYSTKI